MNNPSETLILLGIDKIHILSKLLKVNTHFFYFLHSAILNLLFIHLVHLFIFIISLWWILSWMGVWRMYTKRKISNDFISLGRSLSWIPTPQPLPLTWGTTTHNMTETTPFLHHEDPVVFLQEDLSLATNWILSHTTVSFYATPFPWWKCCKVKCLGLRTLFSVVLPSAISQCNAQSIRTNGNTRVKLIEKGFASILRSWSMCLE